MSNILLVDDDDDSRELLGELLRAQGHDVYLAQNGKEARSMLPGLRRPCTVLLDLNMPEMGGEGVLRTLAQAEAPEAFPVIVISADDRAVEPRHPNVLARLCKPFEFAALNQLLARADALDSLGV
jgi:CheY-like chemotaxis protein